ncbi:MAG TPA: LUD domain-containing protein [Opitutaceae bacterium]|nr:LUD domain-containing protein [Opitutaceae bacterium]
MNDDREVILSRVRGALAPLEKRAPYPTYPADAAVMREIVDWKDPWSVFCQRTKLVNGEGLERVEEVVALLRAGQWFHGYCDPKLWPRLAPAFGPEFKVETEFDRARVDDYQFGITRAVGAIAETGTIILNDTTTSRRLGALAPWVHIAVLRREEVLANVAQAVAVLGDDPNIIWCTGPSKTADVEGILIEGVHGPGRQIALLMS